jgi:FKBP-type peptidyl-prolyl cis-trans isomerase SlyD
MTIAKNSIVSFHYQVATTEGEQVDKSTPDQPLVYLHGHGQIIPGLESAMTGHTAGEHVDATVTPAQAYGEREEDLDLKMPIDVFPEDVRTSIQPGFQFKAQHPTQTDRDVVFSVHAVEDGHALVSGNHPLAGKALQFSIDIVDVRPATAEEMSHGHAHGPGGHHHH